MSSRSWKKVILGSIFLILSIFYTILFFQHASSGDALAFNIAHIKSLENIFTSPINFNYWNHSGSQINLYSPWLTILSGLPFLTFNIYWGFCIYLTLVTFLTFISSYFFMNKFSKDTLESLVFSIIYVFSLNRFFLVFHIQRIENYLVLIFLPMVYYGIYLILTDKGKHWQTLTWGMILIIWTSPYMAMGVFLTLVPLIVLMIFSETTHTWTYWGHLALNLLKTLIFTIVATIGFVAPLIENQLQNKFIQQLIKNINYVKLFQQQRFPVIQQYMLLGIVLLLALLIILIFFKSRFSYKLLLLEMIPLTYSLFFKWHNQYVDLSRLTPVLQSILDLFLAIILSRIIILIFQESPAIFKVLLIAVVGIGFSFMIYSQAIQITGKTMANSRQPNSYTKVSINYHDSAGNNDNHFLVDGRNAEVTFYTKGSDYWVQYYDPESAVIDLPIQKYSGYCVELNNETVRTEISNRQTLKLRTQPGKNIIEIHAKYTIIGIVSLLINLFGFILLIYFSIKPSRWLNKKTS